MSGRLRIIAALGLACCAPTLGAQGYAARPDVQVFIAEMVERHSFPQRGLERLFANARYQDSIVTAITPLPRGTRSWQTYRANFVSPRRVELGALFWRENAATLERAARTFGVPPGIVVAIIGVETEYGRNTGSFRVLDALATLAFDYPRRADYFRSELEQYLLYTRESGLDATALKGSYAGAIGIPQFMPGSIRRFGVDFDSDGRRDLRASRADAIGSVANFLASHGWVADAPIALPARVEGEAYRALVDGEVVPIHRPDVLRAAGVEFAGAVEPETPCVLVELESPNAAPVFLVGLQNFYALTRYNRSSFYAAAVNDLAEEIGVAYRSR
ncbi:MAG TPA: lytic murein transglycosylase B [Burkholderiales bacterium]|nr:lytic murein transglycosylase B [Burkholderiales bacterium]